MRQVSSRICVLLEISRRQKSLFSAHQKTPFSSEWIEKLSQRALDPPFEGIPDDAELVLIEGDFVGWTPLQVARRYVVPNFMSEDSPFTSLSFAIADDESHQDGQVLVPAIDWNYFNEPNYPLRIEGTCRTEPDMTFISVFLLQDGVKGIATMTRKTTTTTRIQNTSLRNALGSKPVEQSVSRHSAQRQERGGHGLADPKSVCSNNLSSFFLSIHRTL